MSDLANTLEELAEARLPLQDRSRASLSRMLDSARQLLVTHGSADFALSDVSRVGRVSIGSIYHRFQNKEELIRVVHAAVMQDLHEEERALIAKASKRARDLESLLAALVENFSEHLKRNAGILRPLMACANKDPAIASAGKASFGEGKAAFCRALLQFRSEIRHPDPDRAVDACFKIIYSSIARDLGFDASHITAAAENWRSLKEDLFDMCIAYLMSPRAPSFEAAAKPAVKRTAKARAEAAKPAPPRKRAPRSRSAS